MLILRSSVFAATACLLFASCSPNRSLGRAEEAFELFHQRYSERRFEEIYENSTAGFQRSVSKDDFNKFMANIRNELGPYKSSTKPDWAVSAGLNGVTVRTGVECEFERGKAAEYFVWDCSRAPARLAYYQIRSPHLPKPLREGHTGES